VAEKLTHSNPKTFSHEGTPRKHEEKKFQTGLTGFNRMKHRGELDSVALELILSNLVNPVYLPPLLRVPFVWLGGRKALLSYFR
jgi:hypothetical protein